MKLTSNNKIEYWVQKEEGYGPKTVAKIYALSLEDARICLDPIVTNYVEGIQEKRFIYYNIIEVPDNLLNVSLWSLN